MHDWDVVVRLVIAMIFGGMIGVEREIHGKEAGFRTYSLVCLGSALIMIISTEIFEMYKNSGMQVDPSRIAAQAITGIGFLGAGAIIRFPKEIKGLTTAAGIWTTCGVGLACGLGLYKAAVASTVLTLFVLIFFSKLDRVFHGTDH